MMKIGCGTVVFRRFELEPSLEAIRKAGFEYFETQAIGPWCPHVDVYRDDPEMLVKLKNKYGFKGITGLWALDGSLIANEKCVTSGKRVIEWAAAAGIPVVHMGDGHKPEGMSDEDAFKTMSENIQPILECARKNRVKIGIEPHGTFSLTLKGLKRIMELGDSDVLGINYDAANIFRACFVDTGNRGARWQKIESHEDELEVLDKLSCRVVHMHAKDLNEQRHCVPVGKGLVKVGACIQLLKDRGYDGVVSLETEGDDGDFNSTCELAAESYKYLSGIVNG